MAISHRYCAICGCSIGMRPLEIGSGSEKAKRIRQRVLAAGLRKRAGKPTEDDDGDDDSGLDDFDPEHSWQIKDSYDPEVMECRDAALPNHDRSYKHVRLVMCDPGIEGSLKCFISGEAEVDEYGYGSVYGVPSRPDECFETSLYEEYQGDNAKAFPCHGLCLQILAKAAVGRFDSKLLNPEVVYKIMYDLSRHELRKLSIDYGDIHGQDQWWICKSGEEYAVTNPLAFYGEHMRTLTSLRFGIQSNEKPAGYGVGSRTNTAIDPFGALANELIHHITSYLDGREVLSLRQASMSVRDSTSRPSYWKPRVEKDMEWLWIPPDLHHRITSHDDDGDSHQIDWMKVYALFDNATARPWGMRGKYMGLANRRRIWTVCEKLRSLYVAHVARSGASLTNPEPDRWTWTEYDDIDTLWRDAFKTLESSEQWV